MANLWQTILDAAWVWAGLRWLLPVSAALIVAWALFRDRPGLWGVPRERCPKCRYDMAGRGPADAGDGSPIVCPECGKAVRDRRALRKTRRRWGLALLAVPVCVGWYLVVHKDDIRRHGWIAVAPTIALMPFVDVEDWYSLTLREPAVRNRNMSLAERLHLRLIQNDTMMAIWFFRVRGFLDDEGIAVVDAGNIAALRVGRVVEPWTLRPMLGPFAFPDKVIDTKHCGAFQSLILRSIDANAWIENGGDWHGPLRSAGRYHLVRATPDVVLSVNQLVNLMERSVDDPDRIHEARIHGMNFHAVSVDYFAESDWLSSRISDAVARERRVRREIERARRLGLGGGGGGDGPYGGGVVLYGDSYAEQFIREECRQPISEALAYATDYRYWYNFGGEHMGAYWVGEILVIVSDGWDLAYFEPALQRIRELGPDAILKEHGVEP